MLHDEHGAFLATTDVRATATMGVNGFRRLFDTSSPTSRGPGVSIPKDGGPQSPTSR
jgi:hypothetical protein